MISANDAIPSRPQGARPGDAAAGRRTRLVGLVLLIGFFLVPILLAGSYYATKVYVFDGISGPDEPSRVAAPVPARWQDFDQGGEARLAVLLTDEDSAWLGLAEGLRSMGVPFRITRDVAQAVRHRVVLAYPTISGRALQPEDLRRLSAHPRDGGTLIGVNVLGGGLNPVFGFKEARAARDRFAVDLTPIAERAGLTEPEERALRLGDPKAGVAQLGTHGYTDAEDALARFEDGTAAITRRRIGTGAAYAFGFDPGAVLLAGQGSRAQALEGAYVNAYAPQGDVVLRIIRHLWREGEPLAVSLGRVPEGKSLAVAMTHDVDYTRSLPNAVAYAEALKAMGVRGTFFIQTKYVRDYNDAIILTEETAEHLHHLAALGMEIASHSVAHARAFRRFEIGTGEERYPDYRPVTLGYDEARGGTILGELRVSKFLLERLTRPPAAGAGPAPVEVVSFRPGHLSNPTALPQALEASGFRYSSSVTVGNALTHLPFRLTYDRGPAAPTRVVEFPITIEDEHLPPMGTRLPEALAVARKIARDGGSLVVLTHPNILGHKLDFTRGFVTALRETAWFGALADLGAWWTARGEASVDAARLDADTTAVTVTAPSPVSGLVVEVPSGWRLEAPAGPARQLEDGRVLIQHVKGSLTMRFRDTD